MTSITMTLSSPAVELKDGKGSLTASVTNGAATPERVVLGAFPGQDTTPPQPSYTTVADPLRTIPPGATEQYVVAFNTDGAAPGSYPVKLIAYSADDAPEDYADQAHVVTLVVPNAPAPPPKKRGFPWLWVIIGAVVLLAVIGGLIWFLLKDATVPNVLDKPQAEAVQILKDAGFSAKTTDKESDQAAGTVLSQAPAGNQSAGRGSTVMLEIATPVRAVVPPVLGFSIESAKTQFAAARIQLDFTQGSTCQNTPQQNPLRFSLVRCVVMGVNPDVGTKVNLNALVLVRTELKSKLFIDTNEFTNECKIRECQQLSR